MKQLFEEELRDYTIALGNAIKSAQNNRDGYEPHKAERMIIEEEIKTLKIVFDDLKGILQKQEGTYWNFLHTDDNECQ